MADEQENVVSQPETAEQKPPAEQVDMTPDPASLAAEIDRLQKVREQREKEAKEAEEKAIYWRKQKAESRADYFKGRDEPKPPEPVQPAQLTPPPRKEDFDDYDKYVEALTEHKTNVKIAQWRQEEESKRSQTSYQEKIQQLTAKLDEGYQAYPDFEEVVRDPSLPITAVIRDILAESEHPADVAYYLGKNRAEAIKVARMTPISAAKEIARIEDKIMADKGNKPNPDIPKLPSAPPPIKPIGSSNTVGTPLEKMTQKEFEEEMVRRTGRRF